MENILIGLIVACLAIIPQRYINTARMASRGATSPIVDGMKEMHYSTGYQLFNLLFLVFFLVGSCVAIVMVSQETFLTRLFTYAFFIFGSLFFTLLAWEAVVVKVRFNTTGFQKTSPWSSSTTRWDQLRCVWDSGSGEDFNLLGSSKKLTVSRYMSGLIEFLRYMDSHVNPEALRPIRKDLDDFLAE